MSLFPYSGNKTRLLKHYRNFPPNVVAVIEPFAGSAAISLASGLRFGVCEADPRIRDFFEFFRYATDDQVDDALSEIERLTGSWPDRYDAAADLESLRPWQAFIVRVTTCGMFRGAANSSRFYRQFAGSLTKALRKLRSPNIRSRLRACVFVGSDYREALQFDHPNIAIVIDPPYLRTTGGYFGRDVSAADLDAFASAFRLSPVLVTYGDGAAADMPSLSWSKIADRKVARLAAKDGGTLARGEFAAYRNWPEVLV